MESPRNTTKFKKKLVLLLTPIWEKNQIFSQHNQWIKFSLTVFLVQSLLLYVLLVTVSSLSTQSPCLRDTLMYVFPKSLSLKEYLQLKAFACPMCLKGSSQLHVMDGRYNRWRCCHFCRI